jgi:hypothetical protein
VGDGVNAITPIFRATHERDAALALHYRRDRVAEELGLWSELSDDTDLVHGRDVIKRGYRWMVRNCQKGKKKKDKAIGR